MNKQIYEACWGGRFVYTCEKHLHQLVAIGQAMGTPVDYQAHHGNEECKNCLNEKIKKENN